jgi:gliding motility-associated-like protein
MKLMAINQQFITFQPAFRNFFLMLVLFWGWNISIKAQLKADFSVDINAGCAPMNVAFTNLSSYPDGTTFKWDFGNGNSSSAISPQATYTKSGLYTIKLKITNGASSDSIIKENLIEIFPQPTVSFSLYEIDKGCAPLTCSFSNQSNISDGSEMTYTWSFGDGNKSTLEAPQHIYQSGGVFDVTLMATSNNGCQSAATKQSLIEVYEPIAKFGVDKTTSCNGSLNAQFNNLSEGGENLTYSWQFGDGNSSNEVSPSHLYSNTGKFSVNLTTTHPYGCISTTNLTDLIQIVKTEAIFSMSADTICPSQNITLTNFSLNANSFTWKFGDGTTDRFKNTTKNYSQAGDYSIWLIASNGICRDSIKHTVNVEFVKAQFSLSDTFLCQLPQTISYIDESINAVKWDWHLGIGKIASTKNTNVVYSDTIKLTDDKDLFTDWLMVTSKHGCTNKATKQGSVLVYIPTVKTYPGSLTDPKLMSGCIPFTVKFSDSTVYNVASDYIEQRIWQLNNGNKITAPSLSTTIETPGIYPVNLTLITHKGCVFSGKENLSIGQTVSPDFQVVGNTQICASVPVDFTITSPDMSMITNAVWDFGDGDKESFPFPPHFYTKTGNMDVKLTVSNYGCKSSITKKNALTILGPYVNFKKYVVCSNQLHTQFDANIDGATSYQWDFGDGSVPVLNTPKPEHTYESRNRYETTLLATNSQTGCSFKTSQWVDIKDPQARITMPEQSKPCPGETFSFDPYSSSDAVSFSYNGNTKKYLWMHQESGIKQFTDNSFQISFQQKGIQHISLVIKDTNGCPDTTTLQVEIFKPDIHYDVNYISGCMPVKYQFNDESESPVALTGWFWTFGDGQTSTLQNPLHEYADFGKYNISLEVSDQFGCKNKQTANQLVQAIEPDASFVALDSTLCEGNTTSFQCTSINNIINYLWEFNDGVTSNEPKPSKTFLKEGNYSVKLSIVDDHDCHTSLTKPDYIKVQSYPTANFSSDALASKCYPFVVQFNNTSTGNNLSSWKWNFGENNNLSLLKNPFYIYNKPGKHTVDLIAYTLFGCSDTISKKDYINVGGPNAIIDVRDTVCKNTDIIFKTASAINVYDMKWDFGDGINSSGDNVVHQYTNAGNIYPVLFLRADPENTCNKAISDTLLVLNQIAKFQISNNQTEGCVPLSLGFNDISTNASTWEWNFNDGSTSFLQNPTHTFVTPGNYNISLKVTHPLGCSDISIVTPITIFPLPQIKISSDTTICLGSTALLKASGGIQYAWQPSSLLSQPQNANTETSPIVNSKFQVTVTDSNHCTDSATTNVWVQHPLKLSLRDTSIIIGETFTPDISDPTILNYLWEPAESVSCITCPNPDLFPLNTTAYSISITDTTNCFTTKHPFNLSVIKKYSIDVPDAFTPNGDGINDLIFVKGWGIKELVYFKVFNRLGQLIYESSDLNQGWNGTYKGVIQPIETYTYLVEVRTYDNSLLTKKGTFKIIL